MLLINSKTTELINKYPINADGPYRSGIEGGGGGLIMHSSVEHYRYLAVEWLQITCRPGASISEVTTRAFIQFIIRDKSYENSPDLSKKEFLVPTTAVFLTPPFL